MSNKTIPALCYPYNLLLAAKGTAILEFPAVLSEDTLAGLHYALSTLPEKDQELVRLLFVEGKMDQGVMERMGLSAEDYASYKRKVLQKIAYPARWNYIQYGIAGYLKKEVDAQYRKGYLAGYRAAMAESGKDVPPVAEAGILDLPIETMELSRRAYNALHRAGCRYIREVAAMKEEEILRVRCMGPKSAAEIARALQKSGIGCTEWYQFLL